MRASAIALALLIACAHVVVGDSVIIGGSLVSDNGQKHNNELHIINGGETVTMGLTREGLVFKEELLHDVGIFNDLISTLVIAGQEKNGFSSRIATLITQSSLSLSPDLRTLTVRLNPDPGYQIANTEYIFFQLAPSVLRCKCSYRLRIVTPVVIVPMTIPLPSIIINHPVICASRFSADLMLTSEDAEQPIPDIIKNELTVSWSVESTSSDSVHVHEISQNQVNIEGVHTAGDVTISVTVSLRDASRVISRTVNRVSSPMPAEVDATSLYISGTSGHLNARKHTVGNWTIISGPGAVINDISDPVTLISNLTHGSVHSFRWEVVGHPQCPVTFADVTVYSETAKIISISDKKVCTDEVSVSAATSTNRVNGTWSVNNTQVVIDTSKSSHEAVLSNLPHGVFKVTWTVYGDKGTYSTDYSIIERLHSPVASILQHDDAFLGQDTFSIIANESNDGSRGIWTVTSSTCTPYPDFSPTSFMTRIGVLEHLSGISEPCRISVQWTLQNPPCSPSTAETVINVVPRPPTKPSVGPDIVLCRDEPVRLSGNEVEVGQGMWEVVYPEGTEILYPQRPKALVPSVEVGKTVLRWVITNGNDSQFAEIAITRHELPESKIINPSSNDITICGSQMDVESEISHFGPGDFSQWGAGSPLGLDGIEASLADHQNMTFVKNTGTFGFDTTGRKVSIGNIPPGLVHLQHKTYNKLSLKDCPEGRAVNLTVRSIQFPKARYTPRIVYTTDSQLDINLEDELLKESHAGGVQERFFGRYLRYLSTLPGEWVVEGISELQLGDSFTPNQKLQNIPYGETLLKWTSTTCEEEYLKILVIRGQRLQCLVSAPQAVLSSLDSSLVVVGDRATVSISGDFPLDTHGTWSTPSPVVDFVSEKDPTTDVRNLPSEVAVPIQYDVSSGISAFAGRCSVKVRSVRAKVREAVKTICSHTTEVDAVPPEEGISGFWRVANSDNGSCEDTPSEATSTVTFEQVYNPSTKVTNIPPGETIIEWVISLRGLSDAARVTIKRDVMKLPFGSESAFIKKTIVGMSVLKLPWTDYPGHPSSSSDWIVEEGCSVKYCPETSTIEFHGMFPGAVKTFKTMIVSPAGSSCESIPFTMEIQAVAALVFAPAISSECELLSGAVMVLQTTKDLYWNKVISDSDVELLKIAFGDQLGPSIKKVKPTSESTLEVHFSPTQLPLDRRGRSTTLVVSNVTIPTGLLRSDVVLSEGSVLLFAVNENSPLTDSFSISPITISLSLSGNTSTTETVISDTGGILTFTLNNINLEGNLNTDSPDFNESVIDFLHSLETKSSEVDEGYGWNSRKRHILGTTNNETPVLKLLNSTNMNTVAVRTKADSWYAISDNEALHFYGDPSTVCSITKYAQQPDSLPAPVQYVRSSELVIRDVPCSLFISGTINECDLEERGSSIQLTARGCSFSEHHPISLSYFKSSLNQATDTSWDTVVARRRLTSTEYDLLPKNRLLIIEPAGPDVYEIQEGKNENLSLLMPRYALTGAGSRSGFIRGQGIVEMRDTYLEVLNGDICADTLRAHGHSITLRLHGDSWVDALLTNKELSSELIGAFSGQQGVIGGWDHSLLTDVLLSNSYNLSLSGEQNTDLHLSLPPMPSYMSHSYEVVGVKIPGLATHCTKCLNHSGIVKVYHRHDLTITPGNITEETTHLTLSVPCGAFSNEVSSTMIRNSLRSVNKVRNGFGVYKENMVSTDVEWVSNNTIVIPVSWPSSPGFNASVTEVINFTLPAAAVIPQPLFPAQLISTLVIHASVKDAKATLFSQWVGGFAAACPVVLLWLFLDFMEADCVNRYINRQGVLLGVDFRSVITKMFRVSLVMAACLWWFDTYDHWLLRFFSGAYKLIGIIGIVLLGSLLGLTDFMQSSVRYEMTHLRSYIHCCIFAGAGTLLHVVQTMDVPNA